MKRRFAVMLLVAAILILGTATALFTRKLPDNGLSVTFQNFTNHEANGRTAIFVITNQRNTTIYYSAGPGAYEFKSNAIWMVPEPFFGRRYGLLTGESWGVWYGTLAPGAWTNVMVPVPAETNIWRAAIRSYRPPGKLYRLLFHLQANWKAFREHRSLPGMKSQVVWNFTRRA